MARTAAMVAGVAFFLIVGGIALFHSASLFHGAETPPQPEEATPADADDARAPETESAAASEEGQSEASSDLFLDGLGLSVFAPYRHLRIANPSKKTGSDFVVERFLLEIDLDVKVPVNLYRPAITAGPHPTVLVFHSHDEGGKAQEGVQDVCQNLTRNGFLAASFDLIGYGEREGAGHEPEGAFFLQAGSSLMALQLWEAQRVVDYLAYRGEINPKRLGATGFSGGGTLAFYLAAADPRIRAIVPVAGLTSADGLRRAAAGHFWVNFFPGQATGPDIGAVLASRIFPRAVRIVAGERDPLFPIDGLHREFEIAREAYCVSEDTCGLLDLVALDMAHDNPQPARTDTYDWLGEHLYPRPKEMVSKESRLLSADDLRVGLDGRPASVQSIVAQLAAPVLARHESSRKEEGRADRVRDFLAAYLFGGVPPATGGYGEPAAADWQKRIERPAADESARGVVVVTGRMPAAELRGTAETLRASGFAVLPLVTPDDPQSVLRAFEDAKRKILDGSSRIAEDARELAAIAHALRSGEGFDRVVLWASGWEGLSAAVAASVADEVDALVLDRYPSSLIDQVDYPFQPVDTYYLSFTDPRLFPELDAPDLLLPFAPKPLYLGTGLIADAPSIVERRDRNSAFFNERYGSLGQAQALATGPADPDAVTDWLASLP